MAKQQFIPVAESPTTICAQFVLPPADSYLAGFRQILSDLDLNAQPDLGGAILGQVATLENLDGPTAERVLVAVGQAIRQWRSDWDVHQMCPLCDRTA